MTKIILTAGAMFLLASTCFAQQKKQIHETLPAAAKSSFVEGEDVYTQFCVSCHLPDGGGVQNMNPSLIKTSYINGDKARIITTVLNGMSQQEIDGERYNNVMPSFNYLTDKQVADVLTFVRNSFGNKKPAIKVADVKAIRAKLVK